MEKCTVAKRRLGSNCDPCNLITKTYLNNFDHIKPHFYIVKMGFTRVYIIFLISAQKHRLWVLGEAVLTKTHNLCFEQKYEKYQNFSFENFQFLVMKFSIYLNRRVFVMPIRDFGVWMMKFWIIGLEDLDQIKWLRRLVEIYAGRTPKCMLKLGEVWMHLSCKYPRNILLHFWVDYLQFCQSIHTPKFP